MKRNLKGLVKLAGRIPFPTPLRLFRQYALNLNAHDPFHKKLLTRLLNPNIKINKKPRRTGLYLTHSTGISNDNSLSNRALALFDYPEMAMPSMGLTSRNGIGFYGSGFPGGAPTPFSSPVRLFFGEKTLNSPRTVIYNMSDVNTPGSGKAAIYSGKAREMFYDNVRKNFKTSDFSGSPGRIKPGETTLVDAILEAFRERTKNKQRKPSIALEVKPYRDVDFDEIRAASIGLGTDGTFLNTGVSESDPTVKELTKILGRRGIPYYFTTDAPNHYYHFDDSAASNGYVLSREDMAKYFAPEIIR